MRYVITSSILLLLLMMPIGARAAVVINEIAWMGSATSANHEWLELYNDGDSAVSLDSWMIKDGLNLSILLSGNIGAKSYAVLERTSDASAPGIAFLIYTGALVNTGVTLTIYNPSGEIIEQVAGGENWAGVGGDNVTKETAQYTSLGWITGEATPGAVNITGGGSTEEENPVPVSTSTPINNYSNSSSNNKSKAKASKSETVRLVTLDTELKLKPDFQTLAYVNQLVSFTIAPGGIGENIINSLHYVWNFGDANTAVGKKAKHAYPYPGTYVVTLRANFARHNQVVRQEITVLPVTFSLTKNEAGDVQINNDAPYDVELSGFRLRGNNDLIFPPDTIIIPRGTITIKASKLGLQNNTEPVTLLDQAETPVASTASLSTLPKTTAETLVVANVSTEQTPLQSLITNRQTTNLPLGTTFIKPANDTSWVKGISVSGDDFSPVPLPAMTALEVPSSRGRVTGEETKGPHFKSNNWVYLALIGLLFLGFIGILWRPNKSL